MALTLKVLVNFGIGGPRDPPGDLIVDANGNLLGTTNQGGNNDIGAVFEIANTATGYAGTPTTLVSFDDTNGRLPGGSLIADANGNLFGTTNEGGKATPNNNRFKMEL